MSTRREKDRLKAMSRDRSFRVERRGDSHYGVAEGFRSKRLMLRGGTTVAGQYLMSKGVHMPFDRLNKTVRTVYSGNSEYAFTTSGNTVRLRRADGSLTQRGTEMYQLLAAKTRLYGGLVLLLERTRKLNGLSSQFRSDYRMLKGMQGIYLILMVMMVLYKAH